MTNDKERYVQKKSGETQMGLLYLAYFIYNLYISFAVWVLNERLDCKSMEIKWYKYMKMV